MSVSKNIKNSLDLRKVEMLMYAHLFLSMNLFNMWDYTGFSA